MPTLEASNQAPRHDPLGHDPVAEENARLHKQLRRLRAKLAILTEDNADLARRLDQARTEKRRLRPELPPVSQWDRQARLRSMLSDPGCRNP
jgi:predicted RNase H-like nuclease (RuvC/YqgF family)